MSFHKIIIFHLCFFIINRSSIASSSDGTRLAAAANQAEVIYLSTDSGATWKLSTAPAEKWNSIASSSDGTKLAAASSTGIYTWSATAQTTPPSPKLTATISSGNSVISWPAVDGGNFVLQQSANLASTSWLNVPWPVTVSNGQYQVVTPPAVGNIFYRLKSP